MTTQFVPLLVAFNDAGLKEKTARGLWGGITPNGEIVVTAWSDGRLDGGYVIQRPTTNRGGLETGMGRRTHLPGR